MLEGTGLLFWEVLLFRKGSNSQGSAKTLSTDSEREEGSLSGREPPSARVEQKEWKKDG